MSLERILERVRECFKEVPENDVRAKKLGPLQFITALLCSFAHGKGDRSLASIRRNIIAQTGRTIAWSTFWGRLAAKRQLKLLSTLVCSLTAKLSTTMHVTTELFAQLGVKGMYLLDSTSITLPDALAKKYPGSRSNVAPAVIKWHLLIDLLGSPLRWFEMTPGKSHDRKSFPPLEILRGALIIFDLGYWDYELFAAIAVAGGFYLSRVKTNAAITIVDVVDGLRKKSCIGKKLSKAQIPKGKPIVELTGELSKNNKAVLTVRLIGFWNPTDKIYHWYITNLTAPALLIYPLYRLRWQIELVFKAVKRSLRLADMPSKNDNILRTLLLASIATFAIMTPIAIAQIRTLETSKQMAFSYQRSQMLFLHLAPQLAAFLLKGSRQHMIALQEKLLLFSQELYDPNFRHRQTSATRVYEMLQQPT